MDKELSDLLDFLESAVSDKHKVWRLRELLAPKAPAPAPAPAAPVAPAAPTK